MKGEVCNKAYYVIRNLFFIPTFWYQDYYTIRWNDKLERIWKESVIAQSRYYPGTYPKENHKKLSG
jgi:hypothetical protein